MNWRWDFAFELLPALLWALRITVLSTVLGMLMALIAGLLWELMRRSRARVVSVTAGWIVEFIRSTPLLVQMYFFFFVLPEFGMGLPALATGILALGLHYSAYTAEVYRAAISAVPRGQWEAAMALNMRPSRLWGAVILPQAIPPVIPVLGNYWIAMFKDTPLLAAITVIEVLQTARLIGAETFRYLEPLTLVGLLFLGISLISFRLVNKLEVRFGRKA